MSTDLKQTYTPMMQQYLNIKEDYADAIVFFRLGDFYEMFFDDAIIASKVLEIALTSRDAGSKVPMCGVPHHAVKPYVQKLIEKGFKIAIAEQTSEPGKGLVERQVTRVITPGTVLEEGILEATSNNFVGSVILQEIGYQLTYIDISTGEAYLSYGLKFNQTIDLIKTLKIKEIILDQKFDQQLIDALHSEQVMITFFNVYLKAEPTIVKKLSSHQKKGAQHLLAYLDSTQKLTTNHIQPFLVEQIQSYMLLDHRVKKHLEILESLVNNPKTTLLSVLDHTQTAMGARRLKYILNHPLLDAKLINQRLDYVQALKPLKYREPLKNALRYIYDINRIVGRVAFQTVNAKDLDQLKETLIQVPKLKAALNDFHDPIIDDLSNKIDEHQILCAYLEKAIISNPPLTIKEGGIIKPLYNQSLDELRNISEHGKNWLVEFEKAERERTGIKNLKVGYNRVFGYYIEVSKGSILLVDDSFGYERKQTLANSERYISPILKEKEDDLLHASEKSIALEYELFKEIRNFCETYTNSLQHLSSLIADIDAFLSLAIVADERNYQRPKINQERNLTIVAGRHPVVEQFTSFIDNDVIMNDGEIFLITGPNMSGKSTYMRMTALIVYMAQIGSFVPAKDATIPIYDAIYTRIGSSDDLSGGKSTFMVEMVESNEALTHATENSLILFDEIGRGTATFDGMALAQGMIEYIATKIKAQTLFSTHYHELTALEKKYKQITNLYVKAIEEKDRMVFLHKVERGSSDKSYGLQVAALANLPKPLLKRSRQILDALESQERKTTVDLFNFEDTKEAVESSISTSDIEVLKALKQVEVNAISPIDALLLIKHYQNLLKKGDE